MDVHPLHVHADLAGVAERPEQRALHDLVEVGVGQHDHRVLAAQLEAGADQVLAGPLADEPAGVRGAGEHHVVGVVDQRRADVRPLPADHPEQALRKAGAVEQRDAEQRRERGLVVRLEHDAVAGHQRRDRIGETRGEREVPRRDDPDDTLRLVDLGRRTHHRHRTTAGDRGEQLRRALEVVRGHHRYVAGLVERHPAGLARLGLDQVDDRLVVLEQQLVESLEDCESLLHRPLGPLPLGFTRTRKGGLDVLRSRLREGRDHLTRVDLGELPDAATGGDHPRGDAVEQLVGDGGGAVESARLGLGHVHSSWCTTVRSALQALLVQDQFGSLLADHDRGCVGVAARDRRHDRGVRDPQPFDPANLQVRPHDGTLVDAHPAGPDTVVDRGGAVEDLAAQVRTLMVGAGVDLGLDRPREGSAGHDLADHLRALGQHLEVSRVGEVAEVDQRSLHRVARREPQGAAALRVDQRRQDRERRPRVDVVADRLVLVGRDVGPRQQVQLQVGYVGRLRGAHEPHRLEDRVRQEGLAGPHQLLRDALGEEVRVAAHRRGGHVERQRMEQVVVQVVADRQVRDGGEAVLGEVVRRSDTGEHQQLGRAHDACGEDDLLAGADDASRAVLVDDRNAGGAPVLDQELGDHHLGLQLQRRHVEVVDVAPGRAVAQPVGGVLLHQADAFLLLGVVVVEDLHAQRVRRRLDELVGALLRRLVAGDPDRAAGAAVVVGAVLEVLHPLVCRVHLVRRPAGVSLGGPGVVVGAVAAHVDHAVDRARTADDLAARNRHAAVEHVLLRGGVEAPVDPRLDLGLGVHRADHAGLLDEELLVALAGLQHDHARAGLGEPARHCGTGAPGPHHDVVGLDLVRRVLGHSHLVVEPAWAQPSVCRSRHNYNLF